MLNATQCSMRGRYASVAIKLVTLQQADNLMLKVWLDGYWRTFQKLVT